MRPTLDINGIWSGFQGKGNKTVTPAEAHLKITCRLVPEQDPGEILDLLEAHARTHCPKGAAIAFERRPGTALPYAIEREHLGLIAAAETLRDLFGKEPAVVRIGGTIAFIGVLAGPPPSDLRLPLMVMQQQRLQGVTVGSVEDLKAMTMAIAVHRMKPVIDKIFPFDQAKQAFFHMESGAHFGKVAIAID